MNPRDFNSTALGRFGQPWALAPKGFELIPKFNANLLVSLVGHRISSFLPINRGSPNKDEEYY